MRFRILFIVLITTTLAQQEKPRRPARTSQAQIKYNDPNGSKVDWKFFAPQNQYRAQLDSSQRRQRGQTEYVHPQQSVQRGPHQSQLVQLQHELDPSQYKVAYQQAQTTQADPRYKGYSQSQLVQPGPQQYKGYHQVQVQPEPQAHLEQQPVQVEYRPYPQPQAQPAQVQYKVQPQTSHHPVDAQPAPIQVHYKTFAPPPAQVDSQPDQIQYKAYQQAQTQPEAQPEQNQIQQKAYTQTQAPIEAQQQPHQQYRPLSEGPAYVKQLLLENFKPQRPYTDLSAFLYTTNYNVPQQHDQQPANAELSHYEQTAESYEQPEQLKTRREYSDRGLQGRIVYKEDYKQQEQQQSPQVQYVQVPVEKIPTPAPPSPVFDKNMPPELRQLLQFQVQLPYDVIANSITYKPKTLFIPKPLPPDASGSYHYRSKVYYMNDDRYEQEPEFETAKPVQEEQRH